MNVTIKKPVLPPIIIEFEPHEAELLERVVSNLSDNIKVTDDEREFLSQLWAELKRYRESKFTTKV